jgi:hypothetical protein
MTCDILIRSYYKDFQWLSYALRSIRRYCRGFSKVVLVVPRASRRKLDWMGLAGDVTITCPDYPDDYLGQQVTKLTADLYAEADYICHIDSDCLFRQNTTPADLLEDGKPRILMTRYTDLDPHVPWKALTERFLGREVEFEFMRTPPYTFPRWIYSAFREHARFRHAMSLEQYIVAQPARGFSEFNALGAYAWHFHRECFQWVEVGRDPAPVEHCRVYWSWGGIDESIRSEMERLLR